MAKVRIITVVVAEIEAAGLEATVDLKSKHHKARFNYNGRAYTYTVPATPSDGRAVKNCQMGIRRLLRQILETDLPSWRDQGRGKSKKGRRG